MNVHFPRVLALLRAERHISQKQAAADLGISQALLSHYEKGIRECGLDFVVRAADYYGVSCDFLLGRSADRTGLTVTVEEVPESDGSERSGGLQIMLNKKLIVNSLNVLFDSLAKAKNRALVTELSSFLMLSVYRAFRIVCQTNAKNPAGMFGVPASVAGGYCAAAMHQCEANASAIASGEGSKLALPSDAGEVEPVEISTAVLDENYPLYAASLLNLVKNAEQLLPTGAKRS